MTRKLTLLSGIFFLSLAAISSHAVSDPTLKEYEEKYKTLPEKLPKTEEVWGRTVKFITQNGSVPLLTAVLKHEPNSGSQTAWYRYDLLEVFKKQNQLTLETSEKVYGGDKSCLLFWLVPQNKLVEAKEIEGILKKNKSALAQSYLTYMKAHIVKGEPQFDRKNCTGKN